MKETEFPFEDRIKLFVRQLESFLSVNIEQFADVYEVSHKESITTNQLISCQIVNFGTEFGHLNSYKVFNCCHELEMYNQKIDEHFRDGNKSIISIFTDHKNDDGLWYQERLESPKINVERTSFKLKYQERLTTAIYHKYESHSECKEQ